ncbi:MAG: GNAT family N-acetyltransferase [Armatimonadetes bacterium]|nr:GNAT family N-acetyltransferase [Armatimonadota bacterium]
MELICLDVDRELQLEQLVLGHASELFDQIELSREHLRPWLAWVDATRSLADTRAFLASLKNPGIYEDALVFAIRHHGRLAGTIGFGHGSRDRRKAELGYWLGRSFVGQGLMTRSCRALIDYAFSRTDVNRLEIRCEIRNRKSWAVPERLGFVLEGIEREGVLVAGTFRDLRVYSMLRREWYRS